MFLLLKGVVDSSGIVFTYLEEKTRTYDAGILFMGHVVDFRTFIPPNAENYTVSSWCPADCNAKVWIHIKSLYNVDNFYYNYDDRFFLLPVIIVYTKWWNQYIC